MIFFRISHFAFRHLQSVGINEIHQPRHRRSPKLELARVDFIISVVGAMMVIEITLGIGNESDQRGPLFFQVVDIDPAAALFKRPEGLRFELRFPAFNFLKVCIGGID